MNSAIFKRFLLVSCWALMAVISVFVEAAESTCPGMIPETAIDDYFMVLDDEDDEVLHIASNLVFMRCSLGQTWVKDACVGEPTPFTWQQALAISQEFIFKNKQSWRLPNIKELNLIAERSCVRPATNDSVFPQTPSENYWTSTPSVTDGSKAWSIAFENATNTLSDKQSFFFVRLVRPYTDTQ